MSRIVRRGKLEVEYFIFASCCIWDSQTKAINETKSYTMQNSWIYFRYVSQVVFPNFSFISMRKSKRDQENNWIFTFNCWRNLKFTKNIFTFTVSYCVVFFLLFFIDQKSCKNKRESLANIFRSRWSHEWNWKEKRKLFQPTELTECMRRNFL